MRRSLVPIVLFLVSLTMVACGGGSEAPPPPTSTSVPTNTALPAPTDTPVPTDTPEPTATPEPAEVKAPADKAQVVDFTIPIVIPDAAIFAVDLLGAWVDAGAPETDAFPYTGKDGATYEATFAVDVQPLFTQPNLWYIGAPSCVSCHHANLENSYHEMDLSSYAGIMAGGDRLSEPPGVPLLGQSEIGATDYAWGSSKMRGRLRNNRMPPGMPFDITEANRDGPTLDVNDTEMNAVDLIMAWVEAGLPETEPFTEAKATFAEDIQPLFTEAEVWYDDAPACTSCHHANLENSYHEMDLSSYEGIMAGGDRLSEPPGVPLFGQSKIGATDFNWDHSKTKERLRNNRMPPGMPFDITEANRDGPWMLGGKAVGGVEMAASAGAKLRTGDCHIEALNLLEEWVDAGAPDTQFAFTSREDEVCMGEFEIDVLPLFTQSNVWYAGAPSCVSCHHANLENSYHEMDLGSYVGIMAGGDRLSEPPGVPLLGQSEIGATDYAWGSSKMRGRLRNNRMPPGMPFDITEANRDGPTLDVNDTEMNAVDLIMAWVEAGLPETEPFTEAKATFAEDIQPLFTEAGVWYEDAPACTSCHHANLENSYHEMDLSSYAGLVAGGDRLSEPPGVPLFGQSEIGATDFNWDHSKTKERLRNNRMPPGMPFDITEANRDGPLVQVGFVEGQERGDSATGSNIDISTPPDMAVVDALVNRGGCKACHLIPQLTGATGILGPAWCDITEEFEEGDIDLAFLYRSIVDPNAEVEEDFLPNLMPDNFGEIFNEQEIETIIAFIVTQDCED